MEIEGSLSLVGLCPVSAITQEPNENPIAFLGRNPIAILERNPITFLEILKRPSKSLAIWT